MRIYWFGLFFWLFTFPAYSASFEANAGYSVCFTPGGDCTSQIVNAINQANQSVFVQAYSFTSHPIGNALVRAAKRGVSVQMILDKSVMQYPNTAWFFVQRGVPVWIDEQPAIAHNKVIILDNATVVTGSFNFTYAAQQNNAENLLIIHDAGLAQHYLLNWKSRQNVSKPLLLSTLALPAQNNFDRFWARIKQWLMVLVGYVIKES